MIRTILVPLDGTAFAEAALSYVAREGLDREATIVLLRAVPLPTLPYPLDPVMGAFPSYPPAALLDQQEHAAAVAWREALQYLRLVKRRYLQGRACRVVVREGDPAQAITEAAAAEGVDLIVMATHGRSGIDRLVRGSVAWRVLQRATVPVLILHQPAGGGAIRPVPADAAVAPSIRSPDQRADGRVAGRGGWLAWAGGHLR